MKHLVLVAILALCLTSMVPNDDRVLVELYSESLCPDCLAFILGSFKKAINTADIYKIADIRVYPYGNARWARNGTTYSFTCQHGVRECQGNIIEVCALQLYDQERYGNPFIVCLESNTSDWTASGQRCATQLGMDWNKIASCSNSDAGRQWQYEVAAATDKLSPAHQYVPWITVNGQHNTTSENSIISNMVSFICKNYKGSVKIAACP